MYRRAFPLQIAFIEVTLHIVEYLLRVRATLTHFRDKPKIIQAVRPDFGIMRTPVKKTIACSMIPFVRPFNWIRAWLDVRHRSRTLP